MKTKLLLSMVAISAAWGVHAQQMQQTTAHQLQLPNNVPQESSDKYFKHYNATNKTNITESFWLNYGLSKDKSNSGIATLSSTYLFTDSLVKGVFGSGSGQTYDYVFMHSIGNVLDVKSQVFKDANNVDWNKFVAYTVDSMSFLYGYTRKHPNPNIVDTLIVHLYSDATSSNLANYSVQFDGGGTAIFKAQAYTYTVNAPKATGMVTIKVPLTIADTAISFLRFKEFSTITAASPNAFSVPAGKLVASAITFKPGYSYSLGDTITQNKNYITIRSLEENGAGTLPSYLPCNPVPNEDVCDWNVSSVVQTNVRYNLSSASSWKGLYIPSYAYTAPYTFEHHYILYKVSATYAVGVDELNFQNGVKLSQNFPNPLNNSTTIKYEITENVPVNLSVYDITGKKVMSMDQGQQLSGVHQINVNTIDLQPGIYLYSLTAGQNKITKRMTVVE